MAALITGEIGPQNFELIRDRVAQILLEELAYQYQTFGDEDLNVEKIYVERMVPFDFTELPALNIGLERGDYSNYHPGHADGDYRFFIECNTRGEGGDEEGRRGDEKSKYHVQKLLGKVRAILTNPIYKTLGFTLGQMIRHHHVESFVAAEPTRMDAENITMSRLVLVVKAIETNALIEANLVGGNSTTVKIGDTNKGYYWTLNVDRVLYEDGEGVSYEDGEGVYYESTNEEIEVEYEDGVELEYTDGETIFYQ